ncbi:hypothetical protein JCM33374_g3813 [Metschnikowia sp. JCM 33374]|nr:hypothetical protein JCM33374_g3813 [Metschnikowia sp. JCM 33374]
MHRNANSGKCHWTTASLTYSPNAIISDNTGETVQSLNKKYSATIPGNLDFAPSQMNSFGDIDDFSPGYSITCNQDKSPNTAAIVHYKSPPREGVNVRNVPAMDAGMDNPRADSMPKKWNDFLEQCRLVFLDKSVSGYFATRSWKFSQAHDKAKWPLFGS